MPSAVEEIPLKLGDFNAQVLSSRTSIDDVVGTHSRGNRFLDNECRLLDCARDRSLKIADTWYQRPYYHRWTWYSNNVCDQSEIDHVLVDNR